MRFTAFVTIPTLMWFISTKAAATQTTDMWWNIGLGSVERWQQLYLLGGSSSTTAEALCDVPGLSSGQRRLCHLYEDHMATVSQGAQQAISECQWQFRTSRWNCSAHDQRSVYGQVLDTASREPAFIYALSSASVLHAVARACRDGELSTCGCSRRQRPRDLPADWLWGDCGDNVEYGYRFAASFVDAREKEKNHPRHSRSLALVLMHLHNNEAGRQVIVRNMKGACKCHGVSGSCSLRTCWSQLPAFREVGNRLKESHEQATQAAFNRQGTGLVAKQQERSGFIEAKGNSQSRLPKDGLVYLDPSPDYCSETTGRVCEKGSSGPDGCAVLCCGRGYNVQRTRVKQRCGCKFFWCCEVKCRICYRTKRIYTCK